MFKKIFIFVLFSLVLVSLPLRAEMANGRFGLDEVAENAEFKEIGKTTPPAALFDTVNKVVSGLLALTAILFFGLISYAGVRWMTAKGNEEFATKAKDTIEAAVIGLIIVAAAYAVTNFIFSKLATQTAPDVLIEPSPPTGCAIITTAADCQLPACTWVAARGLCIDASQVAITIGWCLTVENGVEKSCIISDSQTGCTAPAQYYPRDVVDARPDLVCPKSLDATNSVR